MIGVIGINTTIVAEFAKLRGLEMTQFLRLFEGMQPGAMDCTDWILAGGVIHAKTAQEHNAEEAAACLRVNWHIPAMACERILEECSRARIVVIGSESAYLGSYDKIYSAAKLLLHTYCEHKVLRPLQQLTCISPPIISDAGMTKRRHDYPEVLKTRRTVSSADVANVIDSVLLFGGGGRVVRL